MKIFLSYASENFSIAEQTYLALREAGHTVFFDRTGIPVGEAYNTLIKEEIRKSDRFVFLISPHSVAPGRYTLTELKLAQEKWPHPAGRVLPVMIEPTDTRTIPNYLKAVNILKPAGDVAAETSSALAPRRRRGRLLLAGSALVAAGVAAALYVPAFEGLERDARKTTTKNDPEQSISGPIAKDDFERRISNEAAEVMSGPWRTECRFEIPQNWSMLHKGVLPGEDSLILPGPGTLLDQAGFHLAIHESGGYMGEIDFYEKEMKAEPLKRGFILTHTDQLEAMGQYAAGVIPNLRVLRQRELRYKIIYEDGTSIESEPIDILRDDKENRIVVRAMVLRFDTGDLYEAYDETKSDWFHGYTDFDCSASAQAGEKLVEDLCMALLERTLMKYEIGSGSAGPSCNEEEAPEEEPEEEPVDGLSTSLSQDATDLPRE